LCTDQLSIAAPPGVSIAFKVVVENRTDRAWDQAGANYLRLGVKLKAASGKTWRELPGVILPATTVQPHGKGTVILVVDLPSEAGTYRLLIDLVQEWVCWFSDRGSSPLDFTVDVVNKGRPKLAAWTPSVSPWLSVRRFMRM
jgi:hypothetical protein